MHYVENGDKVFCYICAKAYNEKKLSASSVESAYIIIGYTNWKDAINNFSQHERSKCHTDSVLKIVTVPKTMKDVGECLSSQHAKEKSERRQLFMKILQNIAFLAHQGLTLRGDGSEDDSNYIQLLNLRAIDDPRIIEWLQKKRDKYTSPIVQNEILKIMALKIIQKIAESLQGSDFFTIMADETTDASNKEQMVICIRWVDNNFEGHKEFIGMHEVDSIDASTLYQVIKDVLLRLNLSITKARGQCYDGAAAMSGCRSGVAKRIMDDEPKAVYTHCYGHSLDLAISDTVKRCDCINNALSITHEITKLIKKSPQREARFQHLKETLAPGTPGVRVLCPTRWTIRAESLQSIIDNYTALLETWQESLGATKDTEMRARIIGVSSQMNTFSFFFGVMLGQLLFSHSDNLSRTLQKRDISAAGAQEVASMTLKTLEKIRNDTDFHLFWFKVTKIANKLDVEEPQPPRRRKTPRRFETGNAQPEFPSTVEDHYRRIYFEALDLVLQGIKERFDQPGYRIYCKLECLLLKAAQNTNYSDELSFVLEHYSNDFKSDLLKAHLEIFTSNFATPDDDRTTVTLRDVIAYAKTLTEAQKDLMSEVCMLLKLILVMPATNAVSERSFSALRRIKTFLRTTMTQCRLNNLMVLNIHKDHCDILDLVDVSNGFVAGSEHRLSLFGKFMHE